MMMDWYINQELERYSSRVCEAERQYRIITALSETGGTAGLQSRAMVWIGSKLVEVGRSLQARGGFSIVPAGPALMTSLPSGKAGPPLDGVTYLSNIKRYDRQRNGAREAS
jgi:hypothetical protein